MSEMGSREVHSKKMLSSKKHWLTGQELIPVYQHVADSYADKSREEWTVGVEESNIEANPQVEQEPQDDSFVEPHGDGFVEPQDDNFLERQSLQQSSSSDQIKVLTSPL